MAKYCQKRTYKDQIYQSLLPRATKNKQKMLFCFRERTVMKLEMLNIYKTCQLDTLVLDLNKKDKNLQVNIKTHEETLRKESVREVERES